MTSREAAFGGQFLKPDASVDMSHHQLLGAAHLPGSEPSAMRCGRGGDRSMPGDKPR